MQIIDGLPLTTFSQVDYPIEIENMYDTQTGQTFTRTTSFVGTVTYSGTTDIVDGDLIFLSYLIVDEGKLFISEILVEVTTNPTAGSFSVAYIEPTTLPPSGKVSYYKSAVSYTPVDVTFGLQPSGGATTNFRIRANSQGKGKVFIGEILRQYLPEFLAPKDYETDTISKNLVNIEILFNGQEDNTIKVFYGSKYLANNYFENNEGQNPLGSYLKVFQEQLAFYITSEDLGTNYELLLTSVFDIGRKEYTTDTSVSIFDLYPSIPCKNKIYLSANYGLLDDGELIDVSVPVLAFVNRAGQYEYIRFTGSNVNKYNVQEARLKQDYASTLTNADIGLIYEGIELTLADDNTNQGFAYRIDKLELQRCLALLMESPKAWLLVNGDIQQALEVRVKRESVVFASSFDKTYGNYTAQCEVIITQTLGQPQY
jgi:hypothetical protein